MVTTFEKGQDREAKIVAAGMNYNIKTADVLWTPGLVGDEDANDRLRSFDRLQVAYRDDSNSALAVNGSGFKYTQPRDGFNLWCDLFGEDRIVSAGVTKGGAVYWCQVETGDFADVKMGGRYGERGVADTTGMALNDTVKRYLRFSTAADGSMGNRVAEWIVRLICLNGLTRAQQDEVLFRSSHRSKLDVDAVRASLGDFEIKGKAPFQAMIETLRAMQATPINEKGATDYFAALLRPKPAPAADLGATDFNGLLGGSVRMSTPAPVKIERDPRGLKAMLESYYQAPGANPNTVYGAYNAVTHVVDHVRGKSEDKRFYSANFGQGATLKASAFDAAAALTVN